MCLTRWYLTTVADNVTTVWVVYRIAECRLTPGMQLCSFHLGYRIHTRFTNKLHFCKHSTGNEKTLNLLKMFYPVWYWIHNEKSLGNENAVQKFVLYYIAGKAVRGDGAKVTCISMQGLGACSPHMGKWQALKPIIACSRDKSVNLMIKSLQMEQQLDQCLGRNQ